MSTPQYKPQSLFAESPSLRLISLLLITTAGVVTTAGLSQVGDYRSALVVVAMALGAGLIAYPPVSQQRVLICWFATTPLLSYYLRFPVERSIFTYDRVILGSLVLALLLSWHKDASALPNRLAMSRFEIAWALLALLALASAITKSSNVAYATRIAVDTFLLPLVAFHIARNYVDLRRAGKPLLLVCMAVALFLFVTGAIELATGIDLFAFRGAELVREGERRVNGPFATDSSSAVICLILFLFLLAAPRMFRVRLDRAAKLVYAVSLVAAALGALLTLFRIIGIAMIVCGIFLDWSTRTGAARKRLLSAGVLAAVVLVAIVGLSSALVPSITVSRLTSARTAYGRLATWQAAAELTLANPVFGVGLNNYAEAYDEAHYYADEPPEEVRATKAVDSPHSNSLWISSELGLTGLALYIAASVYLLLTGWRAFKNAEDRSRRGTAACLLALVAAYWISGLTLTTGYYSDLNLGFFFLAGVLCSSVGPLSNRQSIASDFAD